MTLDQLSICATFFGALVALIIFNQWRKQKGSEVIANEATEIVKNLALSLDDTRYLFNYPFYTNKENALQRLESLKLLIKKNKRELLFLRASIEDKLLDSFLDVFLNCENSLIIDIEYLISCHKDHDFLKQIDSKKSKELDNYSNHLDNLITIVRPYSLYQKKVVLKKHLAKNA
jgi:hypothetical protein